MPGPAGAPAGVGSLKADPLRIAAAASPSDPRVCSFTLNRSLVEGSALCRDAAAAEGSPLFEKIFSLPGVVQAWAAGPRVTVAFAEAPAWETTAKAVGRAIRSALADPRPPVSPRAARENAGGLEDRVRKILKEEVNPSLAAHGGEAELVDVLEGKARIRLSGGCQGCGAARLTLGYGIEQTLRSRIPELAGVEDVTDHSAGRQPYYAPGASGPIPF